MTWVNPNYIREVRPDGGITYRRRNTPEVHIEEQPPCVCGCPASDHHAWTGPCHNACGCSYYLADNGIEPTEIAPRFQPYVGVYANRKWAV